MTSRRNFLSTLAKFSIGGVVVALFPWRAQPGNQDKFPPLKVQDIKIKRWINRYCCEIEYTFVTASDT